MSSFTYSESTTFTVTHARHIAAKVSADLKRMQRFYGCPSDGEIAHYEAELIERLKAGYLGTLTVGFLRDGKWIEPTLRYTARDLAGMADNNDDPGRVRPGLIVSQATFYNYLTIRLHGMPSLPMKRTRLKSACRSSARGNRNPR